MEQLIAFESGELDDLEIISLFQHLWDTGKIFDLQGSYQRTCGYLASLDLVHLDLRDPVPGDDGDDDDLSEEDAYRWSPALT